MIDAAAHGEDWLANSSEPPQPYRRAAEFQSICVERDVEVPMRDGAVLRVDVYRPDAPGSFPALLAFGSHSKALQGIEYPAGMPPQPAGAPLWVGHMEAGDTRFFVLRGYVHAIASARGFGNAEGGGSRVWDSFDVIEWLARQPWCDGQVGMTGIGAFAAEQFHAARQQPPSLKTIFAYDPRGAYGTLGSFGEEFPGGVLHAFRYLQEHFSAAHHHKGPPGELSATRETLWRDAMGNQDYRMYPHLYHVLTFRGQHMPRVFDMLIDPYVNEDVAATEESIAAIRIPVQTGAGWYGYTYKMHLLGAQNYFRLLQGPKRLTLCGPTPPDRPLRALRHEMLGWYDYWLKGLDSGVSQQPVVQYWVMGENRWRASTDWPPPEAYWQKLYLRGWERLDSATPVRGSLDDVSPPDSFLQTPPTLSPCIQKLRYVSEPLGVDLLMAGPCEMRLYASIDQDDTNWMVALIDVPPGQESPGRELTRGWLKASHRALDPQRSLPGRPWHPLTRAARQPVVPGDINEYAIEIMATANLFRRGHRIAVEISSVDLPTGVSGATAVEYIPYHVCSARTTVHHIYHDTDRPSHLLLPVMPFDS